MVSSNDMIPSTAGSTSNAVKPLPKHPEVFVVIPTIRDVEFLNNWADQFRDVTIVICEDQPKKSVKIPKVGKKTYHYSWQEIDADLGDDGWIISRRNSAIRSYGFLKAYRLGAEVIITLDDDCYPVKNHPLIDLHLRNLRLSVPKHWVNTYPDARHLYTRGMPYLNRDEAPVMLSHGLWTHVMDHDGATHLQHLNFRAEFAEHFLQIIPHGAFFPMCSMNLAFRRELTPLMYFPLMGEDKNGNKWGYDRFDDIWCGIFAKKVMDAVGWAAINGAPFVRHEKASNPFHNLIKESNGVESNEQVWADIFPLGFKSTTAAQPSGMYAELAHQLKSYDSYFPELKKAMFIWSEQIEKS